MTKSLFVGNIPYGAMERELAEHFSSIGPVHDTRFIMDPRKGRFRGFGFVTMDETAANEALLQMDGKEFQGRPLKVSVARSRVSVA
ncbi:MAG: RNA recognition motif domain-containing protein [Opitutales bacterium]|jgi:RNA recognition motif-containing protein